MSQSILLVDDDEAHRHLIRRALKKAALRYPLREATSLSSARELLLGSERLSPSVMIVDLNLGDGRGTELIRELRAERPELGVSILVLSTSAMDSDIQESYEVGAHCYLTKADDVLQFREEVAKAVAFCLRTST